MGKSRFRMSYQDGLFTIGRESNPQQPSPLRFEIDATKTYPVEMMDPRGSLGESRVSDSGGLIVGELVDAEVGFPIEDPAFVPVFDMGSDGVARLQSVHVQRVV